MRIGNIEFRQIDGFGRPEIVMWYHDKGSGKDFCVTIIFFESSSEGYDIKFVGPRPFDDSITNTHLWALMEYAQAVMDARFKMEKLVRQEGQ